MRLKDCGLIVLGGGKMGSALVKGLLAKKCLAQDKLVLVEQDSSRLDALRNDEDFGNVTMFTHLEQTTNLDIMLLAVKPQQVIPAINACKSLITANTLVISLAAGVTLSSLSAALPAGQPVIRAMPNSGALLRQGVTALSPGNSINKEQMELAFEMFGAVGICVEVPEGQMDAVTALSGSGPAYVAVFAEALIDAGVAEGLNRETATTLALGTIQGISNMMIQSKLHPALLKDMVTSPAGTTIAALNVLESAGFRGTVMNAVKAAAQRSRELG